MNAGNDEKGGSFRPFPTSRRQTNVGISVLITLLADWIFLSFQHYNKHRVSSVIKLIHTFKRLQRRIKQLKFNMGHSKQNKGGGKKNGEKYRKETKEERRARLKEQEEAREVG